MSSSTENGHTKEITPKEALDLITRFLKDWRSLSPQDVVVERIKAGWINRVYTVKRIEKDDASEERKILLKLYGGAHGVNVDATAGVDLTLEAEMIVCHEWSRMGMGPKLLGVFPEGRIEEFIADAHMMKNDDVEDPEIRRDLAITFARFHSMDLPFPKPSYDFIQILSNMVTSFRKDAEPSFRTNSVFLESGIDTNQIADYDFEGDIDFLRPLLDPNRHREVLIHWDSHTENFLIRNKPIPGKMRVVLIDLQQACYNFRGKDFGLHFASLMINFREPSDIVQEFPDEDYCKALFSDYLDEVEKLACMDDIDRSGKDSLEHMLFESVVGAIVSILYFLVGFMTHHEPYTETAPEFAVSCIPFLKFDSSSQLVLHFHLLVISFSFSLTDLIVCPFQVLPEV